MDCRAVKYRLPFGYREISNTNLEFDRLPGLAAFSPRFSSLSSPYYATSPPSGKKKGTRTSLRITGNNSELPLGFCLFELLIPSVYALALCPLPFPSFSLFDRIRDFQASIV
ncbi:hypothetical protein V8C44DRAFT_254624 [Trichoderma aethiopicum]